MHPLNNINISDIQHLLPDAAIGLIQVAGMEAAMALITTYPGTTFPIGRNQTRAGKALHMALAEVVGEQEAIRLETAYAAQRRLWIPKCDDAIREVRNRYIRQQFDQFTHQGKMSSVLAVRNLALANKLTERRVWEIIKQTDRQPEHSNNQQPLF